MADPVILPSGNTYERACLQACAELAFLPPGAEAGGLRTVIPNAALKAAIGTWCARSGRAGPPPPPLSAEAARQAVLRAMPPAAARTTARRVAAVITASTSNSSTSSYGSASEITAAEDEAEAEAPADPLEDDVVGKVMRADDDAGGVVAAAMGALREATREGAERRLALCTPRLLGALRRVLLLPRHAAARVDAAAALVNLSLEPGNRVRIVRAGAVPALVEVLRSAASAPEAREHAAGALFGLAIHEDNRAAIGVLGAVPPLLDLLASRAHPPPRAATPGWRSTTSPSPPSTTCAEGRNALMDAGAVASVSAILLSDGGAAAAAAGLEEWCVSAMYAMSRGSLRFRGLARAAGADRALRRVVADEGGGVRREMARKTLRAMRGDLDNDDGGTEYNNDLTGSSAECEDCGGSIVSDGLMSFRRRQRELGNTAEF
ncbi:U-box domain-containing protein 38 [Zea mays]|uniref:RING-type E3 ubiquitin transferase n=1 Tax=Zea mays TaxID=4577 RepID=A0A3L6G2X2_MAIZE|nr:U-box domain-containing protein 38 [Zea mays]